MRRLRWLLLVLLAIAGCVHAVSYDPDAAQKLSHVAIVVRVLGDASVDLPDTQLGTRTPAQLARRVEAGMSPFEVAERLRAGVMEHLPDAPPWSTVVPSVQAESALGGLLTVDHPVQTPDLDELTHIGVDGVLYVQIDKWGARGDDAQSGLWLGGSAKLLTLPDHDTLWAGPVEAFHGPLGAEWSAPAAIRSGFEELCARAGEQIALQLGGTTQEVSRTPSLQTPEIEDKGHPPPKDQPIIPFAVPEPRDAGAKDAGGGIDITFDGGELPIPGGR